MKNEITLGYTQAIQDHLNLFSNLGPLEESVENAGGLIIEALKQGKKVLICGNGGSAADAQHFAAEFVVKFQRQRNSLPAIALTTDSSILTAAGNDFGFDVIFSRQVDALGSFGDILIALSTSGKSKNVCLAVEKARSKKMKAIGLTGGNGGRLISLVDIPIVIPHEETARIQEAHSFILHFLCSVVDRVLG